MCHEQDIIFGDDDDEMDVDNSGDAEREEEWGDIMAGADEEDDTPAFFKEAIRETLPKTKSKKKKTRVAELVRDKIRKALEDKTKLADKRARECDENDFLRLLATFNEVDIHFA